MVSNLINKATDLFVRQVGRVRRSLLLLPGPQRRLSELGRQSSLVLFYQGLKGSGTIMKELSPFHHVSAAALLFKTDKQTSDSGCC